MSKSRGQILRGFVLALVIAGLVGPILAGFGMTALIAFGSAPALGVNGTDLAPWRSLAALPGIATSIRLTLITGFGSTLLALLLAFGMAAWLQGHMRLAGRLITPLLAAPHAAMAIGLAFVISPSGWIARLLSPWATGWQHPPDLATVHDGNGLALMLGLTVKELPFLLLVILLALRQLPLSRQMAQARALGYGQGQAWARIVAPQVYRLIRLPIYVVLAFGLSVVDMALILGPANPPTLAVAATRWLMSPDLGLLVPGAAAALALGVIIGAGIAVWYLAERLVVVVGRPWVRLGQRGMISAPLLSVAALAGAALIALGLLSILALGLWSLTWRWTFPNAWPEALSLRLWVAPGSGWAAAFATSLSIGLASTALSVTLAICWLEAEDRGHMARARWANALIYLPLMLPQLLFLYGLQVAFLRIGVGAGAPAVIWAHSLFVFPYVMIALSDPWRALDPRLTRVAASLGSGPARILWRVKLPCLLGPILGAAAIGFAVSIAQYLPTLFMGAGRISTLTSEAVALSSGADRRLAGVYGILQALLPLIAYGGALALPAILYRNQRGLGGGAV